jgi:hypothetical protein
MILVIYINKKYFQDSERLFQKQSKIGNSIIQDKMIASLKKDNMDWFPVIKKSSLKEVGFLKSID